MISSAWISFITNAFFIVVSFSSCEKKNSPSPPPSPSNPTDTTTVNPQVDPTLASTIGFFMDDWEPKNFTLPSSSTPASLPSGVTSTVTIDRSNVLTKISRSFAGNNANIWMTQMVTESSLIDHLTT